MLLFIVSRMRSDPLFKRHYMNMKVQIGNLNFQLKFLIKLKVVKILLENGADWKMVDVDGDTAKKFAANNGHTKVVELIDAHAAKQIEE